MNIFLAKFPVDTCVTVHHEYDPKQLELEFPDLKNRHEDWKSLTWMGFSSMATEETTFYLDDLSLKNSITKDE